MISFIWAMVAMGILALIAPVVMKIVFPHRITGKELGASIFASIVITAIVTWISIFGGKFNTEILNGKVTKKYQDTVSCEHSYQVCTGSGNSRTCTTHYDHFNDYDWVVDTTVGSLRIARVDRQGTTEPPRFSKVVVGESAAIENSYLDYLKGNEETLVYRKNNSVRTDFQKLVPQYPRVYDYYRVNHVLFAGVRVSSEEKEEWNTKAAKLLESLGSLKQVNVIIVVANTADASFGEYLRNEWHNGRKNDFVVVIGSTEYPTVDWSYSFGWSKNEMVNSSTSFDMERLETVDVDSALDIIDGNVRKYFQRNSMDNFKHYLWETKIEWWVIVLALLVQLAANIGINVYIVRN